MKLTSTPKLSASMSQSSLYQTMGIGLTDTIVLLGHGDGLSINDPYPVTNVGETIAALGSTTNSPLTFGIMDAYLSGARDIWIVPVAPMSEYQPNKTLRDTAYYQTYAARLATAYEVLETWDRGQIVVPLEAPFNSTVDFLLPLADYCAKALTASGQIHLGLLGTTGVIDATMSQAMATDPRLGMLENAGKYVSIFAGDVSIRPEGFDAAHTTSAVAVIAGELSRASLDRSMAYRRLSYVMDTIGPDLDKVSTNTLAEAGINLVGRNIRGRRGAAFEVVPFSDNTLALEGSDYWSLVQMRLISVISSTVRDISQVGTGTISYNLFRDRVRDYLADLASRNVIKDYKLHIDRHPTDRYRVLVDIDIRPYFGVREINVPIDISPEEVTGSRWSITDEGTF